MTKEVEIWKPVPGYDGILASSLGRIKLTPLPGRNYIPKPMLGCWAVTSSGVGRYIYWIRRLNKTVKIHRLVCLAFHGEPPKAKPNALHKDENSRNNRPDNLYWGSQKENLNAAGFLEYCRGRTGKNNPFIKGRRAQQKEKSLGRS